jgi:acyl-CoA thioester hydrolase
VTAQGRAKCTIAIRAAGHLRETRVLKDYPVVIEVAVRWGDMDLLGHVNNIFYLQYFETARIDCLTRVGMDPPGPAWREYGLILAADSCRFKTPVTHPDTLSVGARVAALGDDRMVLEHAAFSHKLGKMAATGDAILAIEGRELPPLPRDTRSRSNE